MIEEISKNFYRCVIPLPQNPLKYLNSYMIKGKDKNLIIDTGFNRKESREAFFNHLETLRIDPANSEVIITHLHADHSGLVGELYRLGARIFFSALEGEIVKMETTERCWKSYYVLMRQYGFQESEDFFENNPGKAYRSLGDFEFVVLRENDIVSIDDYHFQVITVPGHTPEMINLYEPEQRLYIAADHVLNIITPHISFRGFQFPVFLKQYLNSLKKIYNYNISLMLPAHRTLIFDHRKRIDELFKHHEVRLQEIERILSENQTKMTVQEVAAQMRWRIDAKKWSDYPDAQKWFAATEAMAHLDYLANLNRIKMDIIDGVFYFSSLNNNLKK